MATLSRQGGESGRHPKKWEWLCWRCITTSLDVPPRFHQVPLLCFLKPHVHKFNSDSMETNNRRSITGWGMLAAVLASASVCCAQTRQQTLNLRAGWNAVFLEVEPTNAAPQSVFANTPIDTVARYFPRTSPVQYITDPAEARWNEPGWGVWYAPSRPESVVSSLHAIHGNRPYLVHASTDFTWSVSGRAALGRLSWQADSFNLVGFCVNEQSPPTFEKFFAGAGGRIGGRIYRLDASGRWRPVTFAAATTIRSGEAYWVYCRGKTDYQGPVDVRVAGLGGLNFGNSGSRMDVEFHNISAEAAGVTVEAVPGSGELPLARVVRDLKVLQTSRAELQPVTQLSVAPGQVEALRLEVRREAMSAPSETRLLKITTSQGLCYWVPASAQRPDLAGQP